MSFENCVVTVIVLICLLYTLRSIVVRFYKKKTTKTGCQGCSGCRLLSSGKSCH